MTARFEVIAAVDAPHSVLVPGEEFGYDQLAEDQHGLVLGDPGATTLVLTGHPRDILAYLDAVRAELAATAARAEGPPVPRWRSTWPSPRHAAALARQVGAGWLGGSCRLPLVGAWRQLMNNPRQNRRSRRVARRRAGAE